jgi:hypothetical protein
MKAIKKNDDGSWSLRGARLRSISAETASFGRTNLSVEIETYFRPGDTEDSLSVLPFKIDDDEFVEVTLRARKIGEVDDGKGEDLGHASPPRLSSLVFKWVDE